MVFSRFERDVGVDLINNPEVMRTGSHDRIQPSLQGKIKSYVWGFLPVVLDRKKVSVGT